MAKQVQLRRGTTAQHATFTGAVGEVTIDTDKKVVVVHDGSTVGGFSSQKELISGTNIKTVNSTSLLGSGNIDVVAKITSTDNAIARYDGTGGAIQNSSVVIDDSGNVGIGTSSPSGAAGKVIAINGGSGQARLALKNTSTGDAAGDGFQIALDSTAGGGIEMRENLPLYFTTNNTERMHIDSSGNVLVGTTSLTGASGVGASFKADSNGRRLLQLGTSATATNILVEFFNPNGAVGRIETSASATVYSTSSDYRLKENIQPMQNALGVVAQLNPVTYTWKADGSDGQGFIAHELQAVVPDCVTGEKDAVRIEEYEITPAVPAVYEEVVVPAVLDKEGNVVEAEKTEQKLVTEEIPAVMGEREVPVYQGIDTSFLVATLTKAIQELKAEVDDLKTQLEAK